MNYVYFSLFLIIGSVRLNPLPMPATPVPILSPILSFNPSHMAKQEAALETSNKFVQAKKVAPTKSIQESEPVQALEVVLTISVQKPEPVPEIVPTKFVQESEPAQAVEVVLTISVRELEPVPEIVPTKSAKKLNPFKP